MRRLRRRSIVFVFTGIGFVSRGRGCIARRIGWLWTSFAVDGEKKSATILPRALSWRSSRCRTG